MSLLMDALKKAEQEKKKAAEKLKQSAGQDQPGTTEQAPAESSSEQAPPEQSRAEQKKPAAREGLQLEPIEPAGEITDEFTIVDDYATQADEDSDLNISMDGVPADRVDEDEFEQTGKQPIPGQGPAMPAALREELDEDRMDGTFYGVELESDDSNAAMYEETLQGEPYVGKEQPQLYDETLPGVSAVELARDIGDENQPTPVAAQTIFAASASRRTSSGVKWAMGILGCIIVIVVALGVVFYQSESITPRKLPSPLVARGIEDIVPAQTVADEQAQTPAQPVSGTIIQAQQPPSSTQEKAPPPAAAPLTEGKPATIPERAPATESSQAASRAAAPAVQTGGGSVSVAGGAAAGTPAKQVRSAKPEVAAAPQTSPPQHLPPEIEETHALLKISRSKGPDKNAAVIKAAYDAYQAGDYAAAKEKYEKIIKAFPDSRDGLLGLGAIALYEHDWERAFHLYSRLLTIDPENTIAKAALINLVGDAGQANRESTIKLMLTKNPKSSYLYFSLGNVYASQSRWAEAQQAYFDAYRYDSTSPVYALNLAIALDRMGQGETALDYYKTALKLASGKQAEFDVAKVQARVEAISARIN